MIASWSGFDVRSPSAYSARDGLMLFLGGSITFYGGASSEYNGFAATTQRYCGRHLWPALSHDNQGISGNGSWQHLFRLQTDVIAKAPKYVILDGAANDTGTWPAPAEAMIRLLRVGLPDAKLAAIFWGDAPAATFWTALCNHYGISYCDPRGVAVARIAGGEPSTNYYGNYPSDIHPNDGGHALGAQLLEPIMLALVSDYPDQWSGTIGDYARLYDNGDYENTPQIINATSLTTTGTWTTSGTHLISTDAATPATLSYTGTFQSFAWWSKVGPGQGTYAWRVDGGDWTNKALVGLNVVDIPLWNGTRSSHTVDLKVVSGSIEAYGIKKI